MACLTPTNDEVEFPCDIRGENRLVTINMNTGDMVDRTEVMKGDQCNDLFYEKNNVRSDEANLCLQCVVDKKTQCCNINACPLNQTYVPGFKLKYDIDDYSQPDWYIPPPPDHHRRHRRYLDHHRRHLDHHHLLLDHHHLLLDRRHLVAVILKMKMIVTHLVSGIQIKQNVKKEQTYLVL